MLPDKIDYGYTGKRSEWIMKELLNEILEICNGDDIDISNLINNRDDEYSDENLKRFIRDIIDNEIAGEKNQDLVNFTAKETDYLNALLYVCIRACLADVRCALNINNTDYLYFTSPVSTKTFKGLKQLLNTSSFDSCQSDKDLEYIHLPNVKSVGPVSSALAITVCTLYTMLTDKELVFPNPYKYLYTQAIEKYGSEQAADQSVSDMNDYNPGYEERLEQGFEVSVPNSYEEKDYSVTNSDDFNLMINAQTVVIDESDYTESANNSIGIIAESTDDPSYIKEKKRQQLSFPYKTEFIDAVEHLSAITSDEFAGLEKNIPMLIDLYQKKHGIKIYSNADSFTDMYVSLNRALEIFKMERGFK